MGTTRRILKNSFFLSLTTIADRLAEAVLFFLMARALGPGFVGDYKTVVMFLTVFQGLANFGLTQLVMREVSTLKDKAQASELLISYGFAALVISAGLLIIMNALAVVVAYPPAVTLGIYVVSLALVPNAWRRVAEAVISGLENMQYIALVSFLGAIFRVVITAILLWRGGSLMAIFWVLVITQFAVVPAYFVVINRFLTRVTFRPKFANIVGMAREVSVFLVMGILSIGVGTQLDVLMIRKMTNATDVGLYTAASTVVQTIIMVRPAILNSIFPNMSSFFRSSMAKFQELTSSLLRITFIVLLPIPFATWILAKPLMPFLLGADFASASITLQVLIWVVLPSSAYAALSRALVAGKLERPNINIAGVGMLVNVVFNLILIPIWGPTGAAASSVTSMTIATVLSYVVVRRRLFSIPLWDVLGKPLMCTLIAGVAWIPLRWMSLWMLLPLLAAVYVAALIWLRVIPKEMVTAGVRLIRSRGRRLKQESDVA